jgi:pimeloyl-ACP methyl ester carboxylesterase
MRRLATDRRLIIFDKRTGLSDSVVEWPTFVERVDDMFAVMRCGGTQRVLVGVSEGCDVCALAAARSSKRVAGSYLRSVCSHSQGDATSGGSRRRQWPLRRRAHSRGSPRFAAGVDHHPWIGEVEPVHRALDDFIRAL